VIGSHLSHLQREANRILERIRGLEELSVQDVAKLLKKSPWWVKHNFPVIVHGPRSRHVRIVDVEKYQQRRMVQPKRKGKTLIEVFAEEDA